MRILCRKDTNALVQFAQIPAFVAFRCFCNKLGFVKERNEREWLFVKLLKFFYNLYVQILLCSSSVLKMHHSTAVPLYNGNLNSWIKCMYKSLGFEECTFCGLMLLMRALEENLSTAA